MGLRNGILIRIRKKHIRIGNKFDCVEGVTPWCVFVCEWISIDNQLGEGPCRSEHPIANTSCSQRSVRCIFTSPRKTGSVHASVWNALLLIGGSSSLVNSIIVCSVVKASIDGGRSMIGQLPMTSCVRLVSTLMDSGILEISHIIMCSVWRFAITAILGGNSLNLGMSFNVRYSIPVHWSRHTGRVASVSHPRRLGSKFCSDDSDPNVSNNSRNLMKFDSAMVFNLCIFPIDMDSCVNTELWFSAESCVLPSSVRFSNYVNSPIHDGILSAITPYARRVCTCVLISNIPMGIARSIRGFPSVSADW